MYKNSIFCVFFYMVLGIKIGVFGELKIRVFVLEVLGCFYGLKFGYFKELCGYIFA